MRVRDVKNQIERRDCDRIAREARKAELARSPIAWSDMNLSESDRALAQELMDQSAAETQDLDKTEEQKTARAEAEYVAKVRAACQQFQNQCTEYSEHRNR